MSLRSTKAQLAHLLTDQDVKVIALSGKWGTGKSFMWEELKESNSPWVEGSLYASIFGIASIDQVKLKLIQSAAKSIEDYPGLFKGLRQAWQSSVKVAESFHKGFTALNDIGLILAPAILRSKLLVLDDLERKHEKLSIDEILGFIDEMTKQHDCRVLIILNDDQLNQLELWNTLREKVIDQELRLSTSAEEATAIAIDLEPSPWAEEIAPSIKICGIANIRIARKIIKVANRILSNHCNITPATLNRILPSIVLLAAIHYKGLDDGPDFSFVLDQGTKNDWDTFLLLKRAPETEDEKRKTSWKALMNNMRAYPNGQFELLVIEFLKSGLFDTRALAEELNRLESEAEAHEASSLCNRFFDISFWEHQLTVEQLLDEGKKVVEKADLLDPYMATSLHDTLNGLPGGQALASDVVERWVAAFRALNLKEATLENFSGRKIHPLIQAEFAAIEHQQQENTSVADACEFILKNNGWGDRQALALKTASVSDFEVLIRTAKTGKLKALLWKMVEMCADKRNYEAHFGSAMDNFAQACRLIVQEDRESRLAKLLFSLFAQKNISGWFEVPPPTEDHALLKV